MRLEVISNNVGSSSSHPTRVLGYPTGLEDHTIFTKIPQRQKPSRLVTVPPEVSEKRMLKAEYDILEMVENYLKTENIPWSASHGGINYNFPEVQQPLKAEHIVAEREANLNTYYENKTILFQQHEGKYVVIAKGEIQAIGDSFEEVKDVAMDANQRFVFKVERKEKVIGKLRWPMKRK